MKTSSKRILFILLSLAFIIGAVFVYSSLITASYADVSSLRSKLTSESDSLAKYQTTLGQISNLLNSLQNSGSVQSQASLILPQNKDISYMTNQIVGLSKLNGLSVNSFSTQVAPVQPSQYSIIKSIGQLKGDLKLSGSYSGIKSFLKQVENNILIMDVSDFKVDAGNKSGNSSGLSYSVSLTSYYQAAQ